ncbi:hypothetical protein ABEB36_015560 [Hypothenemus hampei]|uniref:CCHC-type domain-containing protein n=1 Tax=Hypothenemus hampei TaxID=57062 RepID=A0ABD1DZQ2_HYPHA
MNKTRDTYAIIVENKKKTYSENLIEIKSIIKQNNFGTKIKELRSTREGNLLVVTEKDDNILKDIINAINQNCTENYAREVQQTKDNLSSVTIHIRKIDANTTIEEVEEDIRKTLRIKGNIRISKLRLYRNNTQAVTVTLNRDTGNKLIDKGYIRVDAEHVCDGTDNRTTCYKCGTVGHVAINCNNKEHCNLCKIYGHSAITINCPKYRQALRVATRRERKKRSSLRSTSTLDERNVNTIRVNNVNNVNINEEETNTILDENINQEVTIPNKKREPILILEKEGRNTEEIYLHRQQSNLSFESAVSMSDLDDADEIENQ